jgi:hypothetical protein
MASPRSQAPLTKARSAAAPGGRRLPHDHPTEGRRSDHPTRRQPDLAEKSVMRGRMLMRWAAACSLEIVAAGRGCAEIGSGENLS